MATINLRDMGESLSITPLRGLTTREPESHPLRDGDAPGGYGRTEPLSRSCRAVRAWSVRPRTDHGPNSSRD
jgi:hypothetical protein